MSIKVKVLCLLLVLVVAFSGLAVMAAAAVYGVDFAAAFDGLNIMGLDSGLAATIAGHCAGSGTCSAG